MQMILIKNRIITLFFISALAMGAMGVLPASSYAEDPAKQRKLVDESLATLNNFLADPEMSWFQNHVKDAKGLLIIPELIKAGFVFGTSGGRGVLLV